MPIFEYYATFEESLTILEDLCALGFRIIVQPAPADEPSMPSFDTVTTEAESILRSAPGFFLAGSFTRSPDHYMVLKSGPSAGKYLINPMVEGPIMQCSVANLEIVNGLAKLLPGHVSYQRKYQNPKTGEWHPPSAEVLAAFKKAVAVIKKRCVPLEGKQKGLIAPEALKRLRSGQAQLR